MNDPSLVPEDLARAHEQPLVQSEMKNAYAYMRVWADSVCAA